MFNVADPRERVILSMATDLGLRISDFINIKKESLPILDQEPPIQFDIMTKKEDVIANGFLSAETVELLNYYLPTINKKTNPFLFPSNGKRPISDEWLSRLLKKLVEKAQIKLNGKSLTFHCFRKMFLSESENSGIGTIAGKKLCGKTIPKSDDTYLTTVKLREKFKQLKKYLTIKQQPKIETQTIEPLKKAINTLQEKLNTQETITKTISEENLKIKQEFKRIQPVVEFINSFNSPIELKNIFNELMLDSSKNNSLPPVFQFNKPTKEILEKTMKEKDITETQAIDLLVKEEWNKFLLNDEKRMKEFTTKKLPMTKEDYKKKLKARIKKDQRRLNKIISEEE